MNNSYHIYYNTQTNTFYRTHKQTGNMIRSYLNGKIIPKFQPNVTGFTRTKNRSLNQTISFSSSSGAHPRLLPNSKDEKQKRFLSNQRQFKSLIPTDRVSNIKFQQNHNVHRRKNSEKIRYSFGFESVRETLDKTLEADSLDEKTKNYQNLIDSKQKSNQTLSVHQEGIAENKNVLGKHGRKKPSLGFIEMEDMPQQQNQSYKVKPRSLLNRREKKSETSCEIGVYEQIKKERSKLADQHCTNSPRPRVIEKEKFRKQNLKHLQKLMLDRNSAKEKKVFGSDND